MKSESSSKSASTESAAKKKATDATKSAKRTAKQVQADSQALGRKLGKSGREAYDNAQDLIGSVHDVQTQLRDALTHQAKTRPYVAIGTAAGLGFVLAGGLTVRLTSKLMGIGGRMLLSAAAKQVLG